jgi:hypothetical protein
MMSISPHEGQPTVLMLLPSIQKAGQIPCPSGALMRASTQVLMPNDCLPCVFMRAEVYALPPKFSRRASITNIPFAIRAFSGSVGVVLKLVVAKATVAEIEAPVRSAD